MPPARIGHPNRYLLYICINKIRQRKNNDRSPTTRTRNNDRSLIIMCTLDMSEPGGGRAIQMNRSRARCGRITRAITMIGPIQNLTVDIGVEISLWVMVNGTPPGGAPRRLVHTNTYRCPRTDWTCKSIFNSCMYVPDKEKTMIGPRTTRTGNNDRSLYILVY